MTFKYNRSLDLMAAAVEFHQAGKFNSAAKALSAAAKDPSITAALAIVEASNSKAHAKMTASRKETRASSFDTAIDSDEPGEELREVVEENAERIVESGFDDEDDGDDMEASAEGEDDGDADEEVEKAEAALRAAKARVKAKSSKPVTAQARLAQAMKNFEKLK